MKNRIVNLWKEDQGQDLVEYGLLMVLLALFCITAMKGLANSISTALFNNVGGALTNAT